MSEVQNTTYTNIRNWKLFGKLFLTREEIHSETVCDGIPYQITVSQDYYNQEFKENGKQS